MNQTAASAVKGRNRIRRSASDLRFDIINYTILAVLLVIIIYPLYFVVIASFSAPSLVTTGRVTLWIKQFNIEGYKRVFELDEVWQGYANTIYYVSTKTVLSTFFTLLAGYALSRKYCPFRNKIMALFTFTMFFGGGLVPTYLLVKNMGLNNTRSVIIILGMISVYNIIITRTFMEANISESLVDAASIDGCGHFQFFFQMVLPLSPAIIAVLVLWTAVGEWNSWFNAMIYLRDENKYPLQFVLRNLLNTVSTMLGVTDAFTDTEGIYTEQQLLAEIMKYSLIIVSSAPIMMIYPFLQKYFVKGIMIGSVKG